MPESRIDCEPGKRASNLLRAAVDIKWEGFLAGDRAVRGAVSKFIRGVTLSAWYSATDTGRFTDPFNRGYHDKGISVKIPIRLFTGRDSKTSYRHSLSPWTRDVAQDIDRYLPLFERIGRNAGVLLDRIQASTYRLSRRYGVSNGGLTCADPISGLRSNPSSRSFAPPASSP